VTSEFDAFNSIFRDNNAELGGAIFAIQEAIMAVRESQLLNNQAGAGSLVYSMANKISSGVGRDSVFIKLKTEDGGIQPSLRISKSLIKDNWATQDTIHILRSSMKIYDCDMIDNYAHEVSHGFTMVATEVLIETTRISNSEKMLSKLTKLRLKSVDTGYFNLYLGSKLFLSNKSEIHSLVATKQAVLSAISQSSFYASKDVRLINNRSFNREGYTLQFLNTDEVRIEETLFSGNHQININIEAAQLSVLNSNFTDGRRSHIAAKESHVRVFGVDISNSADVSAEGHGISCDACSHMQVYSSNFTGLRAEAASAISVRNQMDTDTEIIGCRFTNNTALKRAGAIGLAEAGSVMIRNSSFTSNSAADPTFRFSDAGAIYFGCAPSAEVDGKRCAVVLDQNVFERNTAQNKGGAMRYINRNFTTVYKHRKTGRRVLQDAPAGEQEPEIVDTNSYVDNFAVQSAEIASYPGSFEYIFEQNNKTFSSANQDEVIFAPGQDLKFIIEIYDQEGRLMSDEQDASCTVQFTPGQDLKEQSTILNADSVAQNGTITFAQLNIRQVPDTESSISIIFASLDLFGNEIEDLIDPPAFKIQARPCEEGESYGSTLTCLPCETSYKLYKVQDEPGVCEPCLANEECFGSNTTAPRAKYWRTSPISENYIKCLNPSACLGGDRENPLGNCAEGYGGFLCADCSGRYRRNGAFVCSECSDPELNIFVSALYFLALISAIITLVKMTMRGSQTRRPLSSVYLKVFLNHFQMLQVISKIKFGWPNIIQQVLHYQQYISSLPTQVISFDCLMIDYLTGPGPEFSFNYLRLVTFATLPVIVIIFSFFFWLVRGCLSSQMTRQQRVDNTISTIAIIWFIFYPTIVSYLASSINCTEFEGVWRLYDDLEEVCWTGDHSTVVFSISIPGLVLWAFGMPLLGLFLVRRSRMNLAALEFHSDPSIYNNLRDRNKLRLGFLTQGFEDEFYYWEIVLLLRKTTLVLLMTFLAPISAGVQSLSAILLLIGFLSVQLRKEPFYDDRLNKLEASSLIVQIAIIYFGLFYQAGKNDPFVTTDQVKYSILFLISAASLQFLTLFMARMRIEMMKATVEKHSFCFWLLSCGRVRNKAAFKKLHNVNQLGNDEINLSTVF